MTQLPSPLVPAEVDLRDFGFMPLHVGRLRDSELVDLSTGDEFKAAVLLWAYAWHQVPAGSLPNEERILAARSGAGPAWKKVRAMALRGFVECSDGRLYHPLIAEAALDAWSRRVEHQEQAGNRETRQERWRAELKRLTGLLRDAGVTVKAGLNKSELLSLCRLHVDGFVDADVDAARRPGDAREIAKTGTETVIQKTNTNPNGEGLGTPPPSAPGSGGVDVDGHEPTPQGRICRLLKAAGMQAVNPGDPRLLALIDQGATDAEFVGAAQEAVDKGKGFAWMLAALTGKRQDAATLKLAPAAKQAPSPTEWRKSERGMRAMHAQLGLKSITGESMDEWDARLLRAWQRAGEPPLTGAAAA